MENKPLIIAHRGASYDEKENTLKAFKLAKKMGADAVEMDVRQTEDGVLVLHHDRGVKKGRKRVWIDEADYKELKQVEEIVGLEEVVKKFSISSASRRSQFSIYLDLKQEGMEEEIVRLLRKYKIKKIFICSTNIWVLKRFEELFPKATLVLSYSPEDKRDFANYLLIRGIVLFIYYLLYPFIFRIIKRKTAHDIQIAALNRRLVNSQVVEFLHSQKIKVFVWDVDRKYQMRKMIEMGVNGIITKRPDVLCKVLAEKTKNQR